MTTAIPSDWRTAAEAAALTGYNAEYVRELARQGKIAAAKRQGGREWWVDVDSLRQYRAKQGKKGGSDG
jgi:phage terminase Nu1 subunit (DNA packaging protein)